MVYPASEDSYLLLQTVNKNVHGRCLDMGTGSGIIAHELVSLPLVRQVVAVDVDKEVISSFEKKRKIDLVHSDLFENINGKFNFIFFNTPYLPQDKGIIDPALYGGKKGYEITLRFIENLSYHLDLNGKCYFLISTLTNPNVVEKSLNDHLFDFKVVHRLKISFEDQKKAYRIFLNKLD